MVTAEKVGLGVRNENIPQTIDGQYVPGFSWLRVPQIRFVEKFNDTFSVGISLESPAEQVTSNTFGTRRPVAQSRRWPVRSTTPARRTPSPRRTTPRRHEYHD